MPKGIPGKTYVTFNCVTCGKEVRKPLDRRNPPVACSLSCASRRPRGVNEERFWARINKTESCWLWTGAKHQRGYGVLRPAHGPTVRVHRLMWERVHGPIPAGLVVCHACDVPSCVNPEHLFLGSQQDNMRDMWSKGRQKARRPLSVSPRPSHVVCPDCGARVRANNIYRHRTTRKHLRTVA